MNFLKFSQEKLSIEDITNLVVSSKCGAISTFIGTTRDNFDGKDVVTLEYEAYETMGVKSMEKICGEIREKFADVENIAIYHRLGTVPVKEASIVIAISSPHRGDAIKATEYCIDTVKKTVPIWKKEIYSNDPPQWKENKESTYPPKLKKFKIEAEQDVEVPNIPSHLIQIKASNKEIEERITKFMDIKRGEINQANVRDFCRSDVVVNCARIDSVLLKRKDSKGHLQVNRVYNNYSRDQNQQDYLLKFIPKDGIEERISNLESQLCLSKPVAGDIYKRIKYVEERLLYLESISPEYIQFWDKTTLNQKAVKKKRIYSIDEIDKFINDLEKKRSR